MGIVWQHDNDTLVSSQLALCLSHVQDAHRLPLLIKNSGQHAPGPACFVFATSASCHCGQHCKLNASGGGSQRARAVEVMPFICNKQPDV